MATDSESVHVKNATNFEQLLIKCLVQQAPIHASKLSKVYQ
jgi:hypothetical protein